MASKIIKSDFKGLNNLVKAMGNGRVVKVGVLGNKTNRSSKDVTNAELGAIHEFGSFSKQIPARSFLRMPIHQKAAEIIASAKKGTQDMVKAGNMIGVLTRIGIACQVAILQAFDTRGFGQWKQNKPATIRRKGSDAPLIDTSQLRRSIDYKVAMP